MEKRAILAALLMAALLMIYQALFFPTPEPEQAPREPVARQAAPEVPAAAPPEPAARVVAPPPSRAPRPPAERPPQRLARVETPLYQAVISSEGGKLQELTLQYRGEKPLVIVGDLGPTGLIVAPDASGGTGEPVPMRLSRETLSVGPGQKSENLVLTGEADGLEVRQTLGFLPETYLIEIGLRLENRTSVARTPAVTLGWSTRQAWRAAEEKFQGQHPTEIVWSSQGMVDRVDSLDSVLDRTVAADWIGLGSIWYIAALVPKTPGFKAATSAEKAPEAKSGDQAPAGRASIAVQATPTIAPGQAWEGRVLVYVGPKEYDRLRAEGLEGAINFGGFPVPRSWGGLPMEWVGIPILLLMKWVYHYVGNYGVAIILLTVITKVLFYPLTLKSMRSMKAMQALAPQINALRSKHQKDPQRLQRETMELYRKHKVNPLGGCLPMIAQVPVFYALYLALSVSVELQNAAFLCFGRLFGVDLWICDLAAHDPTYVLPILMGVTMFVQQKMTPTVGDPRQARMMLLMPFVFTFMFLSLPSGLVLYWTVSNILQIAQQWYLDQPRKTRTATK